MRIKLLFTIFLALIISSCTSDENEEIIIIDSYRVSGHIIDAENNPVSAVQMFYGANDYTLSDSDGNWEIPNLIGRVYITPKKTDHSFDHSQIEVFKNENNIIIVATPTEETEIITEIWEESATWLQNMQLSNGLLESSENTIFVSLYDNSLASLVFIKNGELQRAEQIFDFFNDKIETELLQGNGGFYQFRNRDGENGSRTWMGDNAWLLIALNHYHKASGNQKYDRLASELEIWLRSLQDNTGGLFGGYNENGTQIPKVTEGIITAFNAVECYDNFHKNVLSYLKEQRWDDNEKILVAWPENPAYNHALDLHSLAYVVFKDFPESVLQNADRYLNTQMASVSGEQITGYCFDEDKDVIWLEGTVQMAVAFIYANRVIEANTLLAELEKTMIASTISENSMGIPYSSNYGTSFGADLLWDHADITPAISSTTWYLFAKLTFNPLELGSNKNIPDSDKFWIQSL